MALLTAETQQEIDALEQILSKQNHAKKLQDEVDQCSARMNALKEKAKKRANSIQERPTCNYATTEERIKSQIYNQGEAKERVICSILVIAIILLGAVGVVAAVLMPEGLKALPIPEESMLVLTYFFPIVYTIAAVVYACVDSMTPDYDFFDWISLGGIAFIMFCILAPVMAFFVTTFVFGITLLPLGAIPTAMLVLMILKRICAGKSFARDMTEKEKQLLSEAKQLDDKNNALNEADKHNALQKALREAEPEFANLKKRIEAALAEWTQLEEELKNNGHICEEDLGFAGDILQLIKGRRANTIREALLELDARKREAAAMWHAKMQRELWESQERARQAQRDFEASMHNLKAQQQLKKMTDEIEGIRKDAEYYRRYGQ